MPRPQRARDFTIRPLRDEETRPQQCAQRHCLSLTAENIPAFVISYNYPRLRSVVTRRLFCCTPCARRFVQNHPEVQDAG